MLAPLYDGVVSHAVARRLDHGRFRVYGPVAEPDINGELLIPKPAVLHCS